MIISIGKPYKKYSHTETDGQTFIKHVFNLFSGCNTQPYDTKIYNMKIKEGRVRFNIFELLEMFSDDIE